MRGAAVVRVAQAHRGLVRGARRELASQLPDGAPASSPRLHELRHPLPVLALGQRLEQRSGRSRRARASGTRRRGSCPPGCRSPSCRRSPRRPGRRASSAPRPTARRAGTSRRRTRRRRSCSRRRARRSCRRGRAAARSRAARRTPIAFASSPAGSSCVVVSRSPSASCARGAVDPDHVRVGDERDRAVARDELAEQVERAALVRGRRAAARTTPSASRATASATSR